MNLIKVQNKINFYELIFTAICVWIAIQTIYMAIFFDLSHDELFTFSTMNGSTSYDFLLNFETNPIFFYLYAKFFSLGDIPFLIRLPFVSWIFLLLFSTGKFFKDLRKTIVPSLFLLLLIFNTLVYSVCFAARAYIITLSLILYLLDDWLNNHTKKSVSITLGLLSLLHFMNLITVAAFLTADLFRFKSIRNFIANRWIAIGIASLNAPQLFTLLKSDLPTIKFIGPFSWAYFGKYIYEELFNFQPLVFLIALLFIYGFYKFSLNVKFRPLAIALISYIVWILIIDAFVVKKFSHWPILLFPLLIVFVFSVLPFSLLKNHFAGMAACIALIFISVNYCLDKNISKIPEYLRFNDQVKAVAAFDKKWPNIFWTECLFGVAVYHPIKYYWERNAETANLKLNAYCEDEESTLKNDFIGILTQTKNESIQNQMFFKKILSSHHLIDCTAGNQQVWIFSRTISSMNTKCDFLVDNFLKVPSAQ